MAGAVFTRSGGPLGWEDWENGHVLGGNFSHFVLCTIFKLLYALFFNRMDKSINKTASAHLFKKNARKSRKAQKNHTKKVWCKLAKWTWLVALVVFQYPTAVSVKWSENAYLQTSNCLVLRILPVTPPQKSKTEHMQKRHHKWQNYKIFIYAKMQIMQPW